MYVTTKPISVTPTADDLGVIALRRRHRDRDAEDDEQRAQARRGAACSEMPPVLAPSSKSMQVTASTMISAMSPDSRARGKFCAT